MPGRTRSQSSTTPAGTRNTKATEPDEDVPADTNQQNANRQATGFAGFRLPLPGLQSVDPKRLAWFGGLAALAAIELIEWPVAVVVGVGSVVAERLARDDIQHDAEHSNTAATAE